MNNRLFLYSSLFLVLILLFDASDDGAENMRVTEQPAVPETSSQVTKQNDAPDQETASQTKSKLSETIEVVTDTLRIKIRLSDGGLVSSELLKYPKYFGSSEENVVLLNDTKGSSYTAIANLQSRDLKSPNSYTSIKPNYELGANDTITVFLTGDTNDNYTITKSYTFTKNSHLIKVDQVVKNNSPIDAEWRQYNTISRGDETEGNIMLYTYTGAAYFDTDDKILFKHHHNRKGNRYKVRMRKYIDSNICFLEVKKKNNKGFTNKSRCSIDDFENKLSSSSKKFIKKNTNSSHVLNPVLSNTFNRFTLVNKKQHERVTIDSEILYKTENSFKTLDKIVVIEVKQEKGKENTAILKALKMKQIPIVSFSKYCVGISNLITSLKSNQFKEINLIINKMYN